jgi:hypothetical protein
MLGLLAVMLAGSIMAATASAEAGPFWRHRPTAEGEGSKIEANAPESFKGTGSEQKLKSTIASTAVTINSPSTTVKGNIFNNERQGQIELENVYNQPTLAEPTLKGCLVTVGSRNIVQIKGHLMWKWNGTAEQLTEQPQANQKWDIGFTAVEPRKQGTGTQILSSGTFTTVTLSPAAACGVLAGTFNVTGSEIGIPAPSGLKEWSKTLTVRTLDHKQGTGRLLQHYWDTEFIGAELGLALGPNKATLVGQTTAETSNEVSVFEKS